MFSAAEKEELYPEQKKDAFRMGLILSVQLYDDPVKASRDSYFDDVFPYGPRIKNSAVSQRFDVATMMVGSKKKT